MSKTFLNRPYLVLLGIILIGLFFRAYHIDAYMSFEHDQDLYSLIVKDIVVGHHLRLIGQITSIQGVFIGPLFYYALVPFFFFSGMNPLSSVEFTLLVAVLTIISIYFIWQKFFGRSAALVGTFLYAVSLGLGEYDKWVVPTQLVLIWSVWYIYCIFSLAKGEKKYALPISAILVGLIWHIHIALLSLIFPLILAYFLNGSKKVSPKLVLFSLGIFLAVTWPFWLFELKHSFGQTRALFSNHSEGVYVPLGLSRLNKLFQSLMIVIKNVIFLNWPLPIWVSSAVSLLALGFTILKRYFSKNQIILILAWVLSDIGLIMITKNQISEYYAANMMILPILILSVVFANLIKSNKLGPVILLLIGSYGLVNFYIFVNTPDPWDRYKYKLETVEYIAKDVKAHNYPCIAVNYISGPTNGLGFTYLFWWKGVKIVRASSQAPVYNLVVPYDLTHDPLDQQIKYFGVILPKNAKVIDPITCQDPKFQMLPLLGFTN